MNTQLIEFRKQLTSNRHLTGKRLEFTPMKSGAKSKWLFTIDGEIRNIEHYLTTEEIEILNSFIIVAKKGKKPLLEGFK